MISCWDMGRAMSNDPSPVTGMGTTVLGSPLLVVTGIDAGIIKLGTIVTGPGIPDGTTLTGINIGILGGIGTYVLSANAGVGFGSGAITFTRP